MNLASVGLGYNVFQNKSRNVLIENIITTPNSPVGVSFPFFCHHLYYLKIFNLQVDILHMRKGHEVRSRRTLSLRLNVSDDMEVFASE